MTQKETISMFVKPKTVLLGVPGVARSKLVTIFTSNDLIDPDFHSSVNSV